MLLLFIILYYIYYIQYIISAGVDVFVVLSSFETFLKNAKWWQLVNDVTAVHWSQTENINRRLICLLREYGESPFYFADFSAYAVCRACHLYLYEEVLRLLWIARVRKSTTPRY